MILSYSGVCVIRNDIGDKRIDSLFIPKSKKDKSSRPITEKTINLVAETIRMHKTPTRNYIMRKSYLSSSTVSNAIGILFNRGTIEKNTLSATGRTVTYSLAKK